MSIRAMCAKIIQQNRLWRFSSSWIQPNSNSHNTGIEIYNCVTKQNVPLLLRNPNLATWYTCGPTVYDSSHIGHASCYVKIDIIQRILKDHFNINLVTAMNITDIDDKIIKKSIETNVPWQEISKRYESEFWSDLNQLGVERPDLILKVTENIPEIISFIQKLLDTKQAYIGNDGSVYFSVSSYSNYGKFQKLNNLDISPDSNINKQAPEDFALWKAKKDVNEPSWSSTWGTEGRPGWHIECSAIASKIFGESIDFHAGGLDLKFPHHENEEAQSCCFHNTNQWVNYWVHTGQLNVLGDDQKMSKSLRNTITISKFLESYSSNEFRMACILSNYRNSMEFSAEMMLTARNTLNKFVAFDDNCQAYLCGKKISNVDSNRILEQLNETRTNINQALVDDFNTSKVIGHLSELCSSVNKSIDSKCDNLESSSLDTIAAIKNFVNKTLNTFGLDDKKELSKLSVEIDTTQIIEELIKIRSDIRTEAMKIKNKNLLSLCDVIRDSMKSKGLEIKDHSKGSTWNFKNPKAKVNN